MNPAPFFSASAVFTILIKGCRIPCFRATHIQENLMQIFISGSLAYDRIMDFPGHFADHILPEKIHVLNVCFNINGLVEKYGGTAGNIAYTLAKLGEKPFIVATSGDDF